MKYLMFIYQGTTPTPDDREAWAALPADEQRQIAADYKSITSTPGVTAGLWMQPPETATTVRVEQGRTLATDGPFAELKEAIGGYFVLEAEDLDAAIAMAGRVPAARYGGAVEIRPLKEW